MNKKLIISEEEKNRILELHSEPKEGILDPVKNVYQGLKGVWRGEGYSYFKHLSELGNIVKQLKNLDKPNQSIMTKLDLLKNEILSSKMPQDKKDRLKTHIEQAISHFRTYETYVNAIDRAVGQKIK